ncbi:MAG: LON peptidase substrate-binding domain-containing protein, partial [Clostridia bacterium]|nr:LON peptidase substrate-binding domain-containing protein [Clostridia bacterium]
MANTKSNSSANSNNGSGPVYKLERTDAESGRTTLPTVWIDNLIVFPGIVTSFEIERKDQIDAARAGQGDGNEILIATRIPVEEKKDLNGTLLKVGLAAKVLNILRLTNGHYQLMVEGARRVKRLRTVLSDGGCVSEIEEFVSEPGSPVRNAKAIRVLWAVFEDFLKYIPNPSEEVISELKQIDEPGWISDLLASNFLTGYDDRRDVFLEPDGLKRAKLLADI